MSEKTEIFDYYEYYFKNLYPMGLMMDEIPGNNQDLYVYAINEAVETNLNQYIAEEKRAGDNIITKLLAKNRDTTSDQISYQKVLTDVIFYDAEQKSEYVYCVQQILQYYTRISEGHSEEACRELLEKDTTRRYPEPNFNIKFKTAKNELASTLVTINSNVPEGIQSHFMDEYKQYQYFDIYAVSRVNKHGVFIGLQNVIPNVTDRHTIVVSQKESVKIEEEIRNLRAYNHTYKPIYSGIMSNVKSLINFYGNHPTLEYLLLQVKGLFLVAQIHQTYEKFDLREYLAENRNESGEYVPFKSFLTFLILIQVIHRGVLPEISKRIVAAGFQIPDLIEKDIFEIISKLDPDPYLEILKFAYEIKIPEEINILIRFKNNVDQDIKYIGHTMITFLGVVDNYIKHTNAVKSKRYFDIALTTDGFDIRYFPGEYILEADFELVVGNNRGERGLGVINFQNFLSASGYELTSGNIVLSEKSRLTPKMYCQSIKSVIPHANIFRYEKIFDINN